MGKFTMKGNIPVLEIIYKTGPIVFLKVGDRQIDVIGARRQQGKFFSTSEGVFELDAECEYKLMGNAIYFYNLYNSKPISLQGIEKIQKLYRENKAKEITTELARINTAIEEGQDEKNPTTNPLQALKNVMEAKDDLFSQRERKFLINYSTFDKDDLKLLNLQKMMDKFVTKGTSYRIITTGPILLFGLVGLGVVGFMTLFNPFKLFPGLFEGLRESLMILGAFL